MALTEIKRLVCIDEEEYKSLEDKSSEILYFVKRKDPDRVVLYYNPSDSIHSDCFVTNLTYQTENDQSVPNSLYISDGVLNYVDENLVKYPILDSSIVSVKTIEDSHITEIRLRSGEIISVASGISEEDAEEVYSRVASHLDLRPSWRKF